MTLRQYVLIICSILTFSSPLFADTPLALDTDLAGMLFGHYSASLSFKTRSAETLRCIGVLMNENTTKQKITGYVLGFGYRFYANSSYEGLYYGLGAGAGSLTVEIAQTPQGRGVFFFPYYEMGYFFRVNDRFAIGAGTTLLYSIGQLSTLNNPFFGLNILPTLSLNWQL